LRNRFLITIPWRLNSAPPCWGLFCWGLCCWFLFWFGVVD
jgi:hypothetical protein